MEANKKRKLKSGTQYDSIIPKPDGATKTLSSSISVAHTVGSMKSIVEQYKQQLARLAPQLKANRLGDTLSNIWHFVYQHIQYHRDTPGKEELHTPARIWAKRTHGVDCDDYSIFQSAILSLLGIPHSFRVTKYRRDWQHVYVIVPDATHPRGYWTLDPVTDSFDYEVPYTDKQDHEMSTVLLSGLGDSPDSEMGFLPFLRRFRSRRRQPQQQTVGNLPPHARAIVIANARRNIANVQQQLLTLQSAVRYYDSILDEFRRTGRSFRAGYWPSVIDLESQAVAIRDVTTSRNRSQTQLAQLQNYIRQQEAIIAANSGAVGELGILRRNPAKQAARAAKQQARQTARATGASRQQARQAGRAAAQAVRAGQPAPAAAATAPGTAARPATTSRRQARQAARTAKRQARQTARAAGATRRQARQVARATKQAVRAGQTPPSATSFPTGQTRRQRRQANQEARMNRRQQRQAAKQQRRQNNLEARQKRRDTRTNARANRRNRKQQGEQATEQQNQMLTQETPQQNAAPESPAMPEMPAPGGSAAPESPAMPEMPAPGGSAAPSAPEIMPEAPAVEPDWNEWSEESNDALPTMPTMPSGGGAASSAAMPADSWNEAEESWAEEGEEFFEDEGNWEGDTAADWELMPEEGNWEGEESWDEGDWSEEEFYEEEMEGIHGFDDWNWDEANDQFFIGNTPAPATPPTTPAANTARVRSRRMGRGVIKRLQRALQAHGLQVTVNGQMDAQTNAALLQAEQRGLLKLQSREPVVIAPTELRRFVQASRSLTKQQRKVTKGNRRSGGKRGNRSRQATTPTPVPVVPTPAPAPTPAPTVTPTFVVDSRSLPVPATPAPASTPALRTGRSESDVIDVEAQDVTPTTTRSMAPTTTQRTGIVQRITDTVKQRPALAIGAAALVIGGLYVMSKRNNKGSSLNGFKSRKSRKSRKKRTGKGEMFGNIPLR